MLHNVHIRQMNVFLTLVVFNLFSQHIVVTPQTQTRYCHVPVG